jgi:hypothetical protein
VGTEAFLAAMSVLLREVSLILREVSLILVLLIISLSLFLSLSHTQCLFATSRMRSPYSALKLRVGWNL